MIHIDRLPCQIPPDSRLALRKRDLVDLGLWGLATGKRWVVKAVHAALQNEGLRHG